MRAFVFTVENPMEINPLINQLADLKARTDVLRGYL